MWLLSFNEKKNNEITVYLESLKNSLKKSRRQRMISSFGGRGGEKKIVFKRVWLSFQRTDEWKISDGCVNEGVHYQEMLDTALSRSTHLQRKEGPRFGRHTDKQQKHIEQSIHLRYFIWTNQNIVDGTNKAIFCLQLSSHTLHIDTFSGRYFYISWPVYVEQHAIRVKTLLTRYYTSPISHPIVL